jgi:hypothetical protein
VVQLKTPKPATARHGEPVSNSEQLRGQHDLENTLSNDASQAETALAAAYRDATRRKAVAS